QDYTFGTMVRELDLPRSLNRLPLTEIQFNLETVPEDLNMGGLSMRTYPNAKAASNFDMFFNVIEGKDGLRIDVDYNSDVYSAQTITRWMEHFETVLNEIAVNADQRVADLQLSKTPTVRAEGYGDFDRTAMVQTLVAATAQAHPNAIALEDRDATLSYAQLMQKADALAAQIQAQVPGTGARIAVSMDRSVELVVTLLAILKSGHAYLPLDPTQPKARLQLILETGKVSAIVTDTPAGLDYAADMGLAIIDAKTTPMGGQPAPITIDPEATAYVIFTSGTTGTPKGVEIPHRAVVNFLHSMGKANPALVCKIYMHKAFRPCDLCNRNLGFKRDHARITVDVQMIRTEAQCVITIPNLRQDTAGRRREFFAVTNHTTLNTNGQGIDRWIRENVGSQQITRIAIDVDC
uniref:AMP-binding protein n=1 Tax=uncultured Kiloniella sp. TaxID=1133091 RepID=UPI003458FBDD